MAQPVAERRTPLASPRPSPPGAVNAAKGLAALPLRFEPAPARDDTHVAREAYVARGAEGAYVARGAGVSVWVDARGALLTSSGRSVRLRLLDTAGAAAVEPTGKLTSVSNYLIGNDPTKWRTRVPNYGAVRLRGVYPGVDLLFHGGAGSLEYDFEVAAGAHAADIRMAFDGADSLRVAEDGALLLTAGAAQLRQPPPQVFRQRADGTKEQIPAHFVQTGENQIGFSVEASEGSALRIDPSIEYATYLSGSSGYDAIRAVAVDSTGSAYVTGGTSSMDFPTMAALDPTFTGNEAELQTNAFVAKFEPSGSALVYSTYLGGGGNDAGNGDYGFGVAVSAAGSAYVVGYTNSSNFPTTASGLTTQAPLSRNGFLAVLDPSGATLSYSSYLGGSGDDFANAVAIDATGRAYVVGQDGSPDFPLQNPLATPRATLNTYTAFIAELDPTLSGSASLLFSSALGGAAAEANAVALGNDGRIYVAGAGAPQPEVSGADAGSNIYGGAMLIRLSPGGGAVDYAQTLGSAGSLSQAFAVAVDPSGAAYITGETNDITFQTTPGAFQTTNPHVGGSPGDNNEAFVAKRLADGTSWEYATYLGGSFDTSANGIALDPGCDAGCQALVVGTTFSSDFPSVSPNDAWGDFDAGAPNFLSVVNPSGSALTLSTPLPHS